MTPQADRLVVTSAGRRPALLEIVNIKTISAAAVVLLAAMPVAAQDTQKASSARPDNRGWNLRWDDHPEIEWAGKLRVELHARVQGDGRASRAAVEPSNGDGFDVGRRRIGVEGEIGHVLEFQVERELEKTDPWRDAYVNYHQRRAVQIQAGLFKLPFGLEETTGGEKLDFIYRSLLSARLAPGRDRGLMVHGRLVKRMLGYELGVFAHDGDNARPNGGSRVFGGPTLAGRVTVDPLRRSTSALSDLQGGMAFTDSSLPEGFPAIRGRTLLGVSFFDPDHWVQGHRRRAGVQARWRPGPFSVTSEYVRVSDDRRGQSLEGADLAPLLARGWYLSGAWVVAGAHSISSAAVPRQPLFNGGFGSVQVAMRHERLSFGSAPGSEPPSSSPRAESVAGSGETATTFGATWHPNRWMAIEVNLIREEVGGASRAPVPHLRFWSRVVRFRLAI